MMICRFEAQRNWNRHTLMKGLNMETDAFRCFDLMLQDNASATLYGEHSHRYQQGKE